MGTSRQPPRAALPPAGIRPSGGYFVELDSLRGVAMLLVYAFHVDLSVTARLFTPARSIVSPALAFVRGGYTGVGLFFLLSGFLLAGQFGLEVEGGALVARRAYAARRALRILPLYYAAVIAATLLVARQATDLLRGLPYLLFLNSFERFDVPLGAFSGVWWSLATEVQFYTVLPVVAAWLRPRRRRLGAGILVAYASVYVAFLVGIVGPSTLPGQGGLARSLFGQGPLFLCGALAAWIHRRAGDRIRARLATTSWLRRGGADAALVAALLGLGLLLRWTIEVGMFRDTPPTLAWHVAEGLLWTLVVLLILLAPLRLKPLLCNRVLGGLGVISYSVYIVHVPFVATALALLRQTRLGPLVGWGWETAAVITVLTPLCFALSWTTYRLIERPFLLRKARLDAGAGAPRASRVGVRR